MNIREYWFGKNGYVTTRAEYQLNKVGHILVAGLIGPALIGVRPLIPVTVAAILYWLAGYTKLGDNRHGRPTVVHGLAKLLVGLLAPVLVLGDWCWLVAWCIVYAPVIIWRL